MEVFEATGVKNGKLCGTMLYRFIISENERDEHGQIVKVHGDHRRVGNISVKLYNRLKDNGVEEKKLNGFFPDAVKGGV